MAGHRFLARTAHRDGRRVTAVAVTLVLGLVLLAAACGSDDDDDDPAGAEGTDAPTTVVTEAPAAEAPGLLPAPTGDAFYVPPDPLPEGALGDVIWSEPIEGPEGTSAWRILYLSETAAGEPVAVSGLLYAPDPLPTEDPAPILAVAHGTTGLADDCAPSRLLETEENSIEVTSMPTEITSRYVVVATDYEGLGTPGVHPYAVGLSEGRNVLDSIRAAQRFPGVGTSAESPSVAWGHSQGGGAALLTAELAPTYAPDVNLAGVAAGAPASELRLLASALRESPFFGYIFMAGAGLQAAYPDLDLGTVFTPEGLAAVEQAAGECGGETVDAFAGQDPDLFLKADPGATEPFASILEENSPGVRSTTVPIFLYHGEDDEQIPVIASQLVLDRYCANGTTAYRQTWPGADHSGVVPLALPDIEQYLSDRLAGEPAPTSC